MDLDRGEAVEMKRMGRLLELSVSLILGLATRLFDGVFVFGLFWQLIFMAIFGFGFGYSPGFRLLAPEFRIINT